MRQDVRAGTVAVLAAVTLGAAGCSAILRDDSPPPTPSVAAPTSATPSPALSTPTPTVTPSATPTAALPTSRFEERPQVQAARGWATAVARAINDDDRDLGPARSLMTSHGRTVLPPLFTAEFGRFYPGPVPFTPTAVSVQGSRAEISICLTSAGFSRIKGSATTDARRVDAARITFVRTDGSWEVDELQSRTGSCAKVTVEDLTDPSFVDGGSPTATPAPSAPAPSASAPSPSPSATGINPSG